ncbi:acyltransferase family protein [Alcanivorax jadensis]|uniref:acyltransferase family protein n=1 Tax=Alcanivorax jadensis TaxID=64988 RepID=UPI003568A4E3
MKTTPSYRADIEGLRALAVVLVILYHYDVPGITGGFIGVDVFFVISGFVITQLLQRAFEKGTFQFRDFYARRIRRLVPLFLLVSTVTFLMISPFYIGDAYYIFAKSWLSSLVGLSNIYYFQELSQYFAPETRSLSLLHTWSLAVEEQFYLIWPLALYLAYRFGKGRDGHWPFRITLVGTFALSVYLASAHPAAAYYLLPARLFEFMLGTGVALFSRQLPALGRGSAELLAALGVAMICATAVLLTKHHHFPGYNALWPTLGTALVIYAGLHQTGTVTAPPVEPAGDGVSGRYFLFAVPVALAAGGAVALSTDRNHLAHPARPHGAGAAAVMAELPLRGKPLPASPLELQEILHGVHLRAAADHLGHPVHHPHRRRPELPHP